MPTPKTTRIVIVDDSLVARSFLRTLIASEPDMELVGSAANGQRGISVVREFKPDLVILDYQMPVMDGFEAMQKIREEHPDLPVIIFTSTDESCAPAGLRVLSMANAEWVNKASAGQSSVANQDVAKILVGTIRKLTGTEEVPEPAPRAPLPTTPPKREANSGPFKVLAIGSSTGGPDALDVVLAGLPAELGVPVVIVQHMPPEFTKHLAERLDGHSPLKVKQADEGEQLVAGHAYVAPGGYHMLVERKGEVFVRLNQDEPEHSCRPAVDPLFRSTVQAFNGDILAVVLTGMGRDGADGCAGIREAGGHVIIQDEATSVVWGMPGAVHESGEFDEIRALDRMAPAIREALGARSSALASLRSRVEGGGSCSK